MRKVNLIYLLLVLVSLNAFAQKKSAKNVDIIIQKENKDNKFGEKYSFIGFDDNQYYCLKTTEIMAFGVGLKKDYQIESFDKNLILKKKLELKLKTEDKDRELSFAIPFNNQIYIFSNFVNKKVDKNYLFYESLNKSELKLNNDLKKIAETERDKDVKFNYSFSLDTSLLLVYYNIPVKKKENKSFGFHVFDKSMKQIWEKRVSLPFEDELFEIKQFELDNEGNVYILAKIYNDKVAEEKKDKPNYKYSIFGFTKNQNEAIEYPINMEEKFLPSVFLYIPDNSELACVGIYSRTNPYGGEGTMLVKFDKKSKTEKMKKFDKFSVKSVMLGYSEKDKKKTLKNVGKGKPIDINSLQIKHLILKDNNDIILIGERYYDVDKSNTSGSGSVRSSTEYYYYDIIVSYIDVEGKIQWMNKIFKFQASSSDGGELSSFATKVMKDKLYFVYNDDPKNLKYKGDGNIEMYNREKSVKKHFVALGSIAFDGTKSATEQLFIQEDEVIHSQPNTTMLIPNNGMLMVVQDTKSNERLMKITFKE